MPRCVRVLALCLSFVVVGGLTVLAPSPAGAILVNPNAASSSILCRGFSGCASAGMSSSGYSSVYRSMYWRMYGGHNCTNYVAYRMVHSGMSSSRPWSGSGNATNWGYANSRVTSSVPAVGAVAWWRAYARPAGSSGHVAYVERVVSHDEIIVSQDSWGGDFSWARITRTGGSWPTGFVHFNDVAGLRNTARPRVSGTPVVGSTLTATKGRWSPTGNRLHRHWRASGVNIPGATTRSLVLTPALVGKRISMRVTASRSGVPSVSRSSLKTAAVRPSAITATTRPTISGPARVAATLTAVPGRWSPADTQLGYQWFANGHKLLGRTDPTLTIRPRLVGKPISVTVTGRRAGYDDVAAKAAPTALVAPATFVMSEPATLTGPARTGQTLTLHHGPVTPGDAHVHVQWLRAGRPVAGATLPTYRLAKADLGAEVAAQLTVNRRGYRTLVTRTEPTAAVRSTPLVTVTPTVLPGQRSLQVTVKVTTPEVAAVTGLVGIRMNGVPMGRFNLARGQMATTLRKLPAGRQSFRFYYRGSPLVAPAYRWRQLTIS